MPSHIPSQGTTLPVSSTMSNTSMILNHLQTIYSHRDLEPGQWLLPEPALTEEQRDLNLNPSLSICCFESITLQYLDGTFTPGTSAFTLRPPTGVLLELHQALAEVSPFHAILLRIWADPSPSCV